MKKRSAMVLCVMAMTLIMTACGNSADAQAKETPAPEAAQEEKTAEPEPINTPTPEPTKAPVYITEREVVDGKMQSFLTGEWKDAAVADRRPIAVMIPNNAPAMPQYGISQASIIYEAAVEGRITRLMAVFEDFDDLDKIGPVRSSRDYFVYQAMGYQAIYCNWGLARPYVEELINRDTVQNISAAVEGIYNPAHEAFGRVSRPGYATEFTGYLFIDGMLEAAERLGYDWEYDEQHAAPFAFAIDGTRAEENYADAEEATMIYPGGQEGNKGGYGAYNPYFEYDEEEQIYYRYQDGKEQIDELNGEQLAVANVVFQYCHGEVRDDHDYLAFGVHGEGDAIVFTGGKVIKGTWERYDGDATPARFLDKNGDEIILNQGKTWVCNIWKEYGEFATYY